MKAGKERMGRQIFLCLAFVRFQGSVENRGKVRIGGGCGGFGRHDGSGRRIGWMTMSERWEGRRWKRASVSRRPKVGDGASRATAMAHGAVRILPKTFNRP